MSKNSKTLSIDTPQDERDIARVSFADDTPRGMRDEVETRLRFETLIADLSMKFINLPVHEVDPQIEDAQRQVCQCLGLDLCALWQWSTESPGFLALTHVYRSLEGPPTPEPMDAQEYFPWCLQQMLAGKVVVVSSMEELPPEAARDKEVCRHWGIKSNVTVPLAAGGGPLIGALGFNVLQEERVWPEVLVKRLQLVAQVFANAITRKRGDQSLRDSEERLSLATVAAGLGVWMYDVSCNEFWATENWRRMFGFSPEAAICYESVIGRIHPQDREMVEQAARLALEDQADYLAEYRIVLPDGTERWIAGRGRVRLGTGQTPTRMMGVSTDITERKRMEQALKERLLFEQLLTELTATFINQPPEQIESVIDDSLRRLLPILGHDRSSLAQFCEDTGRALLTHSCAVRGVKPFPVGVFVDEQLPWYIGESRKGKTVFWKCIPDDLPPEAAKEREICLAQDIRSTVAIPLRVGGSVLGAISFSFIGQQCDWHPEVISRLQIIGEIFANALTRKRSDEAIRAALTENEQLRERLERENIYLREQITLEHQYGRIIGKSRRSRRCFPRQSVWPT